MKPKFAPGQWVIFTFGSGQRFSKIIGGAYDELKGWQYWVDSPGSAPFLTLETLVVGTLMNGAWVMFPINEA